MDDIMEVSQTRNLDVTTNKSFKHCACAANRAKWELSKLRSTISCRELGAFRPMGASNVRSHLEYCV